jgi:hypothetical protein
MSASSLISVVTFYIFSCSCLQRTRPRSDSASKHTVKASAHIWREEIENYPQRSGTSHSLQPPPTPITEQPVTPVSMLSLPAPARIHPPVNERHPPVVSALYETGWMTLPPPSARDINSLNRTINAYRVRSRSGSMSSGEPGTLSGVPLAFENMVAGPQRWGRGRYREGVLEDMDGPLVTGVRRGTGLSGASEEGARRADRKEERSRIERPQP